MGSRSKMKKRHDNENAACLAPVDIAVRPALRKRLITRFQAMQVAQAQFSEIVNLIKEDAGIPEADWPLWEFVGDGAVLKRGAALVDDQPDAPVAAPGASNAVE